MTERLIPSAYSLQEDLEAVASIAASCFTLFHLTMFMMGPSIYQVREDHRHHVW
jgi:hypothetical protein